MRFASDTQTCVLGALRGGVSNGGTNAVVVLLMVLADSGLSAAPYPTRAWALDLFLEKTLQNSA